MNRYICAGILADLHAGRNVLVIGGDDHRADLLEYIANEHTTKPGTQYSWTMVGRPAWLRDTHAGTAVTFAGPHSAALAHLEPAVVVILDGITAVGPALRKLCEHAEVID